LQSTICKATAKKNFSITNSISSKIIKNK